MTCSHFASSLWLETLQHRRAEAVLKHKQMSTEMPGLVLSWWTGTVWATDPCLLTLHRAAMGRQLCLQLRLTDGQSLANFGLMCVCCIYSDPVSFLKCTFCHIYIYINKQQCNAGEPGTLHCVRKQQSKASYIEGFHSPSKTLQKETWLFHSHTTLCP